MSQVFVHYPRRGDTLAERLSLEGNPDIGKDWTTGTLEYLDVHSPDSIHTMNHVVYLAQIGILPQLAYLVAE